MPVEAALIKPVVDALLALLRQSNDTQLKRNAAAAVREAIRELLLANPDENKAQARIAIAKAAGILSEDVLLAEDMLNKHRANKARTRGKSSTGRKRGAKSAGQDDKPEAKTAPDKDKGASKQKPARRGRKPSTGAKS